MTYTANWNYPTNVKVGQGRISELAELCSQMGMQSPLLITDPGLAALPMVGKVLSDLQNTGLKCRVFSKIKANPTGENVEAGVADYKQNNHDGVIAFGGGSALDAAKAVALMVGQNRPIWDFEDVGDNWTRVNGEAMSPVVAVPTTAGTGSEVGRASVITDQAQHIKKIIFHPNMLPAQVILDPELTVGLPKGVTAATGMDALIHAVEAFTSKNADSLTDVFACQAMERLYTNIRTVFQDGSDITARANMLEGSLLAGMAFANAGVTAVHAFAYPIGAEFHIPHGVANSIMLTPVMEFNMSGNLSKFATIGKTFGHDVSGMTEKEAATLAVDSLRQLAHDLQIPKHLSEFGIKDSDIPGLAKGVMKVTRLLDNNPRILTLQDAEDIYKKVL